MEHTNKVQANLFRRKQNHNPIAISQQPESEFRMKSALLENNQNAKYCPGMSSINLEF